MEKVLLLVLDGWGVRRESRRNAILKAKTPVLDLMYKRATHTTLGAAGGYAGLPEGVMGNSEVGHLTIGAGRVVDSDLVRINKDIAEGGFWKNKQLNWAVNMAKRRNKKMHLMGLLSDAGVHSHYDHLIALLRLCKARGLSEVYVHAFLDGRDCYPTSGIRHVRRLLGDMKKLGTGSLASIMGRFYAMDRDNRWGREHKAYEAMVECKGRYAGDALAALRESYRKGITDEFVEPTLLLDKCVVEDGDSVIFFNFRSDRARELTRAFVSGRFGGFRRKKIGKLCFVTLTQYEKGLEVRVAYGPQIPKMTLGEAVARRGLRQLRVAESEKWAHVTYFMNGLCECVFPKEDRVHIRSRKVKTHDKAAQMRCQEIADEILRRQGSYNLIIANIANGDMVGHTGNFEAAVKAVEMVDLQIGRLVEGFCGIICITADHGNCEYMGGKFLTSHTTARVPFIIVRGDGRGYVQEKVRSSKMVVGSLGSRGSLKISSDLSVKGNFRLRGGGGLGDVAPTVLELMEIRKPKVMSGKSLIVR